MRISYIIVICSSYLDNHIYGEKGANAQVKQSGLRELLMFSLSLVCFMVIFGTFQIIFGSMRRSNETSKEPLVRALNLWGSIHTSLELKCLIE